MVLAQARMCFGFLAPIMASQTQGVPPWFLTRERPAEPVGAPLTQLWGDAGSRPSTNAATALTVLVESPPAQHRTPPPPGAACVLVRLTCSSQVADTSPQLYASRRVTSQSVRKPRPFS